MRFWHAVSGAILAWALMAPGEPVAAAGLVHAADLAADAKLAAQRKLPVLVLFSSPDCHYCERVKAEYLVPMQQDPAFADRVVIREVTVGSMGALVDFAGAKTTEGEFASASGVFMVPTVQVFDASGHPVGDALVGLLNPDFYYGYLIDVIDRGLAVMRPPSAPAAPQK